MSQNDNGLTDERARHHSNDEPIVPAPDPLDLIAALALRVAALESRQDEFGTYGTDYFRAMERTCEACGDRFPTVEHLQRHVLRRCHGDVGQVRRAA